MFATDTDFISNNGAQGSAIQMAGSAGIFITRGSFRGNSATGSSASGGAIWNSGKANTISLTDVNFSSNYAQSSGGAIFTSSPYMNILRSVYAFYMGLSSLLWTHI